MSMENYKKKVICSSKEMNKHTHTHTHTYTYIYTPGGLVIRTLASQARGRRLDPRAGQETYGPSLL